MSLPALLTSVPDHERAVAEQTVEGATLLEAPLTATLAEAHPGVRVLAVSVHDPVPPRALAPFDHLAAVVTRSDGFDHLPLDWLRDRGVAAYHLGDYAVPAVAAFTIGVICSLLHRVPEARATTQGESPRWFRDHLVGRRLAHVTVGVLGTGRIGSRVVEHLASLGATVVGHDLEPAPGLAELEGVRYAESLEALLAESDVLTVHVPLTSETRGLIDREALARLPRGAVLVNTARGAVVDQEAVVRALDNGQLAGYAADVLPGEPDPPALSRFRDRDDVIVTPHLAAFDHATIHDRYARTGEVVRAVLEGRTEAVEEFRIA